MSENIYDAKMREQFKIKLHKKRGAKKTDITDDNRHFIILLETIYQEEHENSTPTEIARSLYEMSEYTDITRTSEYAMTLRQLQRWQEAGFLKKSPDKKQHNVSYFHVDYSRVLQFLINTIKEERAIYPDDEILFEIDTNNIYSQAFIRAYLYGLASKMSIFENYSLREALLNMIFFLYEERYKGYATHEFELDGFDLNKYGLFGKKVKDGCFGYNSKDFEKRLKEIPKSKLNEVRLKMVEDFEKDRENDVILNPDVAVEKFEKKDAEKANFFLFLSCLNVFYDGAGYGYRKKCASIVNLQKIVAYALFVENPDKELWHNDIKNFEKKKGKDISYMD